MCGLAGMLAHSDVNQELYDALLLLQHRGQDAAGICTEENGILHARRRKGLVSEVFRNERTLSSLPGHIGLAHVRYPTAGGTTIHEIQPLFTSYPYGISLAHNGNITNTPELKAELERNGLRHINSDNDSEILLNYFADSLQKHCSGSELDTSCVFAAVRDVQENCMGAYSVVVQIIGKGLLAFRDPHGIRPLCYGTRTSATGEIDHLFTSESVVIESLGFEPEEAIAAGEAVFVDIKGKVERNQHSVKTAAKPCIFEFVYLARPDSVIDGISVYRARMNMGSYLAKKIKRTWSDHDIDLVISVPDTSRIAALELASQLDVPFREGLIKNRYIGRTFIMPEQGERQKSIRRKLHVVSDEVKGKNVMLVDDSIVRGNTSKQIVQMVRDAGANKVYFASAAPPVLYPNVYGIDMPCKEELLAYDKTLEQISSFIGSDKLIYQDLKDLIAAVSSDEAGIEQFECSVFDGVYITSGVDADYLNNLGVRRSNQAKLLNKQHFPRKVG